MKRTQYHNLLSQVLDDKLTSKTEVVRFNILEPNLDIWRFATPEDCVNQPNRHAREQNERDTDPQDAPATIGRWLHATIQSTIAFWVWRRFSAWVKIRSAWASKVASSISFPRYAGRQCITATPGLAHWINPALI